MQQQACAHVSGIGVDRPEECVHFFGAHVVVDFDARGSVNLWCTARAGTDM